MDLQLSKYREQSTPVQMPRSMHTTPTKNRERSNTLFRSSLLLTHIQIREKQKLRERRREESLAVAVVVADAFPLDLASPSPSPLLHRASPSPLVPRCRRGGGGGGRRRVPRASSITAAPLFPFPPYSPLSRFIATTTTQLHRHCHHRLKEVVVELLPSLRCCCYCNHLLSNLCSCF
ncbi:uncharacterized protein LOC110267358 [Arachis ipaensis]|uniref:uncharacterized protein LOC110267358 n=1 Tax=Arachis ipaensis TaxID=130454 RepID=UPI000A2B1DF3|nr:uncharacterized protein LOC110267358 [Arachis ipaensis]XP_029145833.1 uncharacterized protein LOC114924711 [Arachis hypogaea]